MRNTAGKSNRNLVTVLIVTSLLLVASLAGVYLYTYMQNMQNQKYISLIDTDTFYSGIYIDNINIGGMTKEEAKAAIRNNFV